MRKSVLIIFLFSFFFLLFNLSSAPKALAQLSCSQFYETGCFLGACNKLYFNSSCSGLGGSNTGNECCREILEGSICQSTGGAPQNLDPNLDCPFGPPFTFTCSSGLDFGFYCYVPPTPTPTQSL